MKHEKNKKTGQKVKKMKIRTFIVSLAMWWGIIILFGMFSSPYLTHTPISNLNTLMVTSASAYPGDAYEPNDSAATAAYITSKMNSKINNLYMNDTDADFFYFDINQIETTNYYFQAIVEYNESIENVGFNMTLYYYNYSTNSFDEIYNQTQTSQQIGNPNGAYITFAEPLQLPYDPLSQGGNYYILGLEFDNETKTNYGNQTVEYSLTLIFDDLGSIRKDLNSFDDATEIVPGFYNDSAILLNYTYDSFAGAGSPHPNPPLANQFMDFYTMLLFADNYVFFNFTYTLYATSSTINGITIEVYYPNRTLLSSTSSDKWSATTVSFNFTAPISGYYYFVVNASTFADGSNSISNDFSLIPYSINWTQQETFDVGGQNNLASSATSIYGNDWERAGLHIDANDDDWYRFNASEFQVITITADFYHSLSDINLYLYMANQTTADTFIASSESFTNQEKISERVNATGTYYLKVNSTNTDPKYYNLSILVSGPDDDFEDNDHPSLALLLEAKNATYDTLFLATNDYDYFFMPLMAGDIFYASISYDDSLGELNLKLIDEDLNVIAVTSGSGGFKELSYTMPRNAPLIVGIEGDPFTSVGVPYTLQIILYEYDDQYEPNDDQNQAVAIGEQETFYSDMLIRGADEDWYYFYLKAGDYLWVNLTFDTNAGGSVENDIDLYAYDPGLNKIAQSIENINTGHEEFNITATIDGFYYVRVQLWQGSSVFYTLQVDYSESDDPYEDNDNIAQATDWENVTSSGTLSGSGGALQQTAEMTFKSRPGDSDFYKIFLEDTEGIIATVTFNRNDADFILRLYDGDGQLLEEGFFYGASEERLEAAVNKTTVYYLEVKQLNGTAVDYTLNITIGLASELFPPATPATLPYLPPPLLFQGGFLDPVIVGTVVVIGAGAGAGGFIAWKSGKLGGLSSSIKGKFSKKEDSG